LILLLQTDLSYIPSPEMTRSHAETMCGLQRVSVDTRVGADSLRQHRSELSPMTVQLTT
jgi:hypothetical protein